MLRILKEEEISYNKELIDRLSNDHTKFSLFRQNPYKGWAVLTRKCGREIGAYTPEGKIDVYETANTGFRFVTSYRIIKKDMQNISKLDERFIEVEFGEYPQEPVEAERQGKLDSDTFKGKIYETGKTYTSNDIVYNKPYKLVEVVDEEGQKYVLKSQVWYKVQPVKWIVDLKTGMAMSKCIMNGNIYFGDLNPTRYHYEYMRERGMDMDSILRKLGEEIKPSQLPQDIKTLKPAVHPSMYIHDIRIDETEEYKRLLKNHQNN